MRVVAVVGVCDIREMTASAGIGGGPLIRRFSGRVKHVSLNFGGVVTSDGFLTEYPSDITRGE